MMFLPACLAEAQYLLWETPLRLIINHPDLDHNFDRTSTRTSLEGKASSSDSAIEDFKNLSLSGHGPCDQFLCLLSH